MINYSELLFLFSLECPIDCLQLGVGELKHGADSVQHVALVLRVSRHNEANDDVLQILKIGSFPCLATLQPVE